MARFRRRQEDVVVREVGREILLLDLETGRIHQLNETAGFIWRRCEDAPSVEAIALGLATEFDVGQDKALEDVTDTLGKLQALNLVIET